MKQNVNFNHTLAGIQQYSGACELHNQLSDQSVELLRQSGVVSMLQPKRFGGQEAPPADFLRLVMSIASNCPAAGWIAGVVGVHPWEAAFSSNQLLEELWADDPELWIASPYAPMGEAKPVHGGYMLTGSWTFSSGCDHAKWFVLGARITKACGESETLHVMLPSADVCIDQKSWQVDALQGTGSKNIKVINAFIPAHRAIAFSNFFNGQALKMSTEQGPLYRMPWSAIFPSAITSAVLGICEGMVNAVADFIGHKARQAGHGDPTMLQELAYAERIVRQSQNTLIQHVEDIYQIACAGEEISIVQRANARADQVLVAHQAVGAINHLFSLCGGSALHSKHSILRFWRDANAGLTHATFAKANVFEAQGAALVGLLNEEQTARALI